MRKFFAPEVVQTSGLDCGPAALKCLLEGFGIHVSYGRLREACQTGLDGTSIDTMESVANDLGLEAEQIMLPVDHLLVAEARGLPAIVVVRLANGVTHFVVVWRRVGNLLQVMDPAVGRRWIHCRQFARDVYVHAMPVAAGDWREFAASDDFQLALKVRLRKLGIGKQESAARLEQAAGESGWRGLATLDAATRLLSSLASAGISHRKLLQTLCEKPELIPRHCWPVTLELSDTAGNEQLRMAGAVVVRVKAMRPADVSRELRPELEAAVETSSLNPAREIGRALWKSGWLGIGMLFVALLGAAAGTLIEALLFRGLLSVNAELTIAGQRLAAIAALLLFGFGLLLFEAPIFLTGCRLGRQLENRLRVLFLEKIPKLGDRYFQSRLTSDMAERSHAAHRLRHLPDQARQAFSAIAQLAATSAGIIWLDARAAPFVLPAMAASLLPFFCAQSLLVERDLRARTHAAGLTRFYLDAMLGLLAIRAHGAERLIRHEHAKLLSRWAIAALRLQRVVTGLEAVQLTLTCGFTAALLLSLPPTGAAAGRLLLLAYWALNLPVLGQELGALARQYPAYRNLTLRLLEPLGSAEEVTAGSDAARTSDSAPAICFREVSAEASGQRILSDIDLAIAAGSHVAMVGPSGAGKSSLAGLLLGWLKPSAGAITIDGGPLSCEQLRSRAAWVDPGVQLWNRSLFGNLIYGADMNGSAAASENVGEAIDAAMLRQLLEGLPSGLQTKLGEGGALVSGGEGQRVRFGRALLRRDAKLVILDEPFRGLDREKRRELLRRAREFWRHATLICITHDVAETQLFDQVVVMEGGRIAEQGAPAELNSKPDSRYSQLLAAEEEVRRTMWSGSVWRRVSVHAGRIVPELPRQTEPSRASEVA